VYDLLRPIQGIHVPVHLGNIDLATPYYYEGICELVHMMFLSFGGKRISHRLTTENGPLITKPVNYSARAIHNLGVLHKDLEPRNILWNEEFGRAMVIDFERAEIVKTRTILGVISPNRKRKRGSAASMAKEGVDNVFVRERRRAATELTGLT
jgi:tRNA A-37 threonylcarbamoyl transferase component Bud32